MARGAPPRPETIERRSASRAAAAPAGRNVSKNLSPARARMHAHAAADTGGIERLLLSRSLSSGGSSDLWQLLLFALALLLHPKTGRGVPV